MLSPIWESEDLVMLCILCDIMYGMKEGYESWFNSASFMLYAWVSKQTSAYLELLFLQVTCAWGWMHRVDM